MWHEARKQERRIRGLIVDYRRRAERRQDFYERIQADPTQFIQIHGRRCKIHLDPAVAAAGDGAAIIVPWQGQQDNLIDRFDVRAHLDYIPVTPKGTSSASADADNELTQEERQCNYERFRILAQNDFLNITEEKFLHQLYLEEQFGASASIDTTPTYGHGLGQSAGKKKTVQKVGAAIGYSYDEPSDNLNEMQPFSHLHQPNVTIVGITGGSGNLSAPTSIAGIGVKRYKDENESETESESDVDMDVSIDVTKLDTSQAHELNACGRNYGMLSNDFYSFLTKDADDADALRIAREEQREKLLLSGRKSRRERKAQKERRIANRPLSPPSYAAKEEEIEKAEDSDSRSPSPAYGATEKITYITSFGGEDELQQPHSKISINFPRNSKKLTPGDDNTLASEASTSLGRKNVSYAEKLKENAIKCKGYSETSSRKERRRHSRSTSRSRSRSRSSRHRYRLKSRSRSYGRRHGSRRRSRSSNVYHRRYRRDERRRTRSRSRSLRRTRSKSRGSPYRHHHYSSTSHKYRLSFHKTRSRSGTPKRRRSNSRSSSSSSPYSRVQHTRFSKMKRSPISKFTKISPLVKRNISRSSSPVRQHIETKHSSIEKSEQPKELEIESTPTSSVPVTATTSSIATSVDSNAPAVNTQSTFITDVIEPPPPPLKRYYGRKRDQCSSMSSSSSSDESESNENKVHVATVTASQEHMDMDTTSEKSNPLPSTSSSISMLKVGTDGKQAGKFSMSTSVNVASYSNPTPETKGSSTATGCSGRLNLRERLKRKMQNLLNKQYKADKKAEIEKTERDKQLQQERDEEMRELALKLRRRQRELRHRYGSGNSMESESNVSDVGPILGIALGGKAGNNRKGKRSKSRSIEQTDRRLLYDRARQLNVRRRSESDSDTAYPSGSRRSRSYSRHNKNKRKSRSRSRSRRSHSRRRRRSASRNNRRDQRDSSRDRSSRYGIEKSRYAVHDRVRSRSRSVQRYQNREKNWPQGQSRSSRDHRDHRSTDRDRGRDRDYRYHQQSSSSSHQQAKSTSARTSATVPASTSQSSSSSRVVISAPPKLKKLVDY